MLLGAPQGSSLFEPSPKGSLDVEESAGGAGEPHASSVFAGAETQQFEQTVKLPSPWKRNQMAEEAAVCQMALTRGPPGIVVWFGPSR